MGAREEGVCGVEERGFVSGGEDLGRLDKLGIGGIDVLGEDLGGAFLTRGDGGVVARGVDSTETEDGCIEDVLGGVEGGVLS